MICENSSSRPSWLLSDAESDRFTDPFNATHNRKSDSSTEEPLRQSRTEKSGYQSGVEESGHQSSTDEEAERELKGTATETGDVLTRVTEQATSIVQNQIVPAARQVVKSGSPTAMQIGTLTIKLILDMAKEFISSPWLAVGLLYGYMLDNKIAPETFSQCSYRVLVSGEPPPQFSQ